MHQNILQQTIYKRGDGQTIIFVVYVWVYDQSRNTQASCKDYPFTKGLFGCLCIYLNPHVLKWHVLKWVGVKIKLCLTPTPMYWDGYMCIQTRPFGLNPHVSGALGCNLVQVPLQSTATYVDRCQTDYNQRKSKVVWTIIVPWTDLRHLRNLNISGSIYKVCWKAWSTFQKLEQRDSDSFIALSHDKMYSSRQP
jgi:hypothetical protein